MSTFRKVDEDGFCMIYNNMPKYIINVVAFNIILKNF